MKLRAIVGQNNIKTSG